MQPIPNPGDILQMTSGAVSLIGEKFVFLRQLRQSESYYIVRRLRQRIELTIFAAHFRVLSPLEQLAHADDDFG